MAMTNHSITRFLLIICLPLLTILTAACSESLSGTSAQYLLEINEYPEDVIYTLPQSWNFKEKTWNSESGQSARDLGGSLQSAGLIQIEEKHDGNDVKYSFNLTPEGDAYRNHASDASAALMLLDERFSVDTDGASPYLHQDVLVAKVHITDVTGVRMLNDSKTQASVEFDVTYELLPFGKVLSQHNLVEYRDGENESREEEFILYDGRWRLSGK